MQISPAFVREAYNLLRQSIIHVEQDDIDFDEEELTGERDRAGDAAQAAAAAVATDDVEMGGVETSEHPIEESFNESGLSSSQAANHAGSMSSPTRAGGSGAQLAGTPVPQQPPAPTKRKLKITHDKFAKMQNLIVLHLQEIENRTGKGVDRDELIDWYLESMEDELQTVEDLEYEKDLFGKVLRKLAKVGLCLSAFWCISLC